MDISFINHASLLLTIRPDCYFLTDPWYLSPAFGGWTQSPSPPVEAIRDLLAIPAEHLNVIVSHGHDDHLDEFFIQKHLRGARFFVPRFKTNGLAKRIERLTGRYPVELDESTLNASGVSLNCFINPDFTQYDAIITIKAGDEAVVHANDNWHEYPEMLLNGLNSCLAPLPASNRYFFVQFGIADCFPLNYPAFDRDTVLRLINERFQAYHAASMANLHGLGLAHGFHYANQSIYQYPGDWNGPPLYRLAQQFLAEHRGPYTQCQPGTEIKTGLAFVSASETLFEFCLGKLQVFINAVLRSDLEVRLLTSGSQYDAATVALETSPVVWARILIGELTLESIIIGGMGLIHKPAARNISDIHHKLSKLSYMIQGRIQQAGLNFYFGN